MANVESTEYANRATATSAGTPNSPNVDSGRIRVKQASKTQDFAQNDVLQCFVLPAKARVLYFVVTHNLGVSSLTFDIDANDGSDRVFVNDHDASSDETGVFIGSEYTTELATEALVELTLENANPPADGAITLQCFYVVD